MRQNPVYDTSPIIVEYKITEYAKTVKEVVSPMGEWSENHRKT